MKSKEDELLDCLAANCDAELEMLAAVSIGVEQLQQISPTALAYLGDAVYELYVRSYYLYPPKRLRTYHHLVIAQVKAETQALHLLSLTSHLNSAELEVVRQGRNAATGKPRRVAPEIYQQATSLETLIGYLYLTDRERLHQLLKELKLEPYPKE